jgi:flavin reductase (DIM6/NTAB) family NADH-FMN oxidoreductase RutF
MRNKQETAFSAFSRNQFRQRFQPSRIVIGIFPDSCSSGVNLITLCFNMYCSYKPPMMSFAIFKRARSNLLARQSRYCVLSVPGESLAAAALYCGINSGNHGDKLKNCGLSLVPSFKVPVPGIAEAIANIEMEIINRVETGDHLTVFARVLRFGVDQKNTERGLISVAPNHEGYELLAASGIHRIAAVKKEETLTDFL